MESYSLIQNNFVEDLLLQYRPTQHISGKFMSCLHINMDRNLFLTFLLRTLFREERNVCVES